MCMGRVCWTLPTPQDTDVDQTIPEITNYRVSPTFLLPSKPSLCFSTGQGPLSSEPRWAPSDLHSSKTYPGGLSSPPALSFPCSHPWECSMEQQEGWEVSQLRCAGCRCCCSTSRELSLGSDPAEPRGPRHVSPTRSSVKCLSPSGMAALYLFISLPH